MKWFINLPMWARLTIGLSVAAGMFVLIWYLNSERQKHEPVWAEGDKAVFWPRPQLPLKVYAPDWEGHTGSVRDAVKTFGEMVGCTLMVMTNRADDADITILNEGCETGPNHAGCTFYDPAKKKALIKVGQPGDVTQSYVIFYHELTHAWGLAHDGVYPLPQPGEKPALFVPITADNAGAHSNRLGQGALLPALSDKDREALWKRYCSTERTKH